MVFSRKSSGDLAPATPKFPRKTRFGFSLKSTENQDLRQKWSKCLFPPFSLRNPTKQRSDPVSCLFPVVLLAKSALSTSFPDKKCPNWPTFGLRNTPFRDQETPFSEQKTHLCGGISSIFRPWRHFRGVLFIGCFFRGGIPLLKKPL